MSRKCRHQMDSKSSTLKVFVTNTQQPLYYVACSKCDAHTGFYLTVHEAKAQARAGNLTKGVEL